MVSFNWKKTIFIVIDSLLAVYVILAMTAFNNPDPMANTCNEVAIHLGDNATKGFLTTAQVKAQLQHAKLYPLGDPMDKIDSRKIEELLVQSPFVKGVQCYKTQTGRLHITLVQRVPVIRVKADSGDDYYVDEEGNVMPSKNFPSDLVVATGHIRRKYAQSTLCGIGNFLAANPFWRNQVEQVNVLEDGTVELVPRVGNHIVYLGSTDNLERKFDRLGKFYKYGLSKAGWNKYSYISLEFDNQIICKKRSHQELL